VNMQIPTDGMFINNSILQAVQNVFVYHWFSQVRDLRELEFYMNRLNNFEVPKCCSWRSLL